MLSPLTSLMLRMDGWVLGAETKRPSWVFMYELVAGR